MIDTVAAALAVACPSVAHAASLPTTGPALRDDLDGDGRRDRVAVVFAPRAPARCGFLLTAHAARGWYAVRLAVPSGKPVEAENYVRGRYGPRLLALAAVDRRAGLEPVVALWRGASTEGGSVYTVAHGRLVRMRIGGSRTHEFSWWGSLAHSGGVDCVGRAGSGLVATRSGGLDAAGRPAEARALYRVRGTTFELVRARERRGYRFGTRWRTDISAVPAGPPFRRCTVMAAPR